MKTPDQKKRQSWIADNPILTFFIITLIIFGFLCGYYYLVICNFPKSVESGQFGDMFGGANALFAGLAFAGVIIAIILQRQELTEQRSELKQARVENTFFSLLNIHQDIVNSMKYGDHAGRDVFSHIFDDLRGYIYAMKRDHASDLGNDSEKIVDAAYLLFYDQYQAYLGHYFRHIYRTIKFIDNSDVENKGFYTGILRAQLSNIELLLLFYNGLSTYGAKFKPLIEKYGLLDNIPEGKLYHNASQGITKEDLLRRYKDNAFK